MKVELEPGEYYNEYIGGGGGGGGGGYYGGGGGNANQGGGSGSDYLAPQVEKVADVQSGRLFDGEGIVQVSFAQPANAVVNSTGSAADDPTDLVSHECNTTPSGPVTCTLRAAIEVANQTGGGSIRFDIPQGNGNMFDGQVPQIQDQTGAGMPAVTSATTIDGTSQPSAGRVELSGTSGDNGTTATRPLTTGLTLSVPGAAIKGMVINGYSDPSI